MALERVTDYSGHGGTNKIGVVFNLIFTA